MIKKFVEAYSRLETFLLFIDAASRIDKGDPNLTISFLGQYHKKMKTPKYVMYFLDVLQFTVIMLMQVTNGQELG